MLRVGGQVFTMVISGEGQMSGGRGKCPRSVPAVRGPWDGCTAKAFGLVEHGVAAAAADRASQLVDR